MTRILYTGVKNATRWRLDRMINKAKDWWVEWWMSLPLNRSVPALDRIGLASSDITYSEPVKQTNKTSERWKLKSLYYRLYSGIGLHQYIRIYLLAYMHAHTFKHSPVYASILARKCSFIHSFTYWHSYNTMHTYVAACTRILPTPTYNFV